MCLTKKKNYNKIQMKIKFFIIFIGKNCIIKQQKLFNKKIKPQSSLTHTRQKKQNNKTQQKN